MDPNANLDQQLDLAKQIIELVDNSGESLTVDAQSNIIAKAEELAERVMALDHWLTGLGFLPERWAAGPQEAARMAASKAHAEGRRVGIEVLASAVKKTLSPESLENLVRVLSAPRG